MSRSRGVPEHSAAMTAFLAWLRREGLSRHDCTFLPAVFPGTGRGARARRDVAAGDVIVSVPPHLILSLDAMLQSPLRALPMHGRLSDPVQLAAFILYQRNLGPASRWHLYMAVLPLEYNTTLSFTAEEIALLPASCRERATATRAAAEREYGVLCEIIASSGLAFGPLVWADYVWAMETVSSRAVSYEHTAVDGSRRTSVAVVPLMDMLNHAHTASTRGRTHPISQRYEIVTDTPFGRGDEVFICYGARDNDAMLVEYGFVIPGNPYDTYQFSPRLVLRDLPLDLSAGSVVEHCRNDLLRQRARVLLSNGLIDDFSITRSGPSWRLTAALAIMAMGPRELPDWCNALERPDGQAGVARTVAALCKAALADPELDPPSAAGLTGNAQTAIAMRLWLRELVLSAIAVPAEEGLSAAANPS
eukprot:m.11849 g.11849  ORF g.11849 m.11849 type:complete len:419 (+) comp2670_c1_seq1:2-1258(+)